MLAAGTLLCVPSAQAQTPQAQSPQGQSPQGQSPNAQGQQAPDRSQPQANIPDQKLDAAAAAIKQVASIKQDYQRKLDSAAPSDQDKIATEANDALQKAVTDQGLSVDEYSSILEVAQNDPDVRQKIIQRLNQANRQ
jgi:predicted ATPase with chaperone activity